MSDPGQQRSEDRIARERAAAEVSDVLLNLDYALMRAKKAHGVVQTDGADANAGLALGEAIRDLERVRKRLIQDTYYAVERRLT